MARIASRATPRHGTRYLRSNGSIWPENALTPALLAAVQLDTQVIFFDTLPPRGFEALALQLTLERDLVLFDFLERRANVVARQFDLAVDFRD